MRGVRGFLASSQRLRNYGIMDVLRHICGGQHETTEDLSRSMINSAKFYGNPASIYLAISLIGLHDS